MFNIIAHLLFIPISGCRKGPRVLVCPGAHNIAKMALFFSSPVLNNSLTLNRLCNNECKTNANDNFVYIYILINFWLHVTPACDTFKLQTSVRRPNRAYNVSITLGPN